MSERHPDAELIEKAGGTAVIARLCRVTLPSVSEWKRKGIPDARRQFLELAMPHVFGRGTSTQPTTRQDAAGGEAA